MTTCAQLDDHRRFVSGRAFHFAKRGLPPSLEIDDLIQVGMIEVAAYYEKNPVADAPLAQTYLNTAVDGALLKEINRARFGVSGLQDGSGFALIPFSFLSEEDERDFLEGVSEGFGFSSALIRVPTDPETRLKIFTACTEALRREFDCDSAYEQVKGLYPSGQGVWEFRLKLLGRDYRRGGFASRKDAANAKRDTFKKIRDCVLPIDPSRPEKLSRERNVFRKALGVLGEIPVAGRALPEFLYLDPLRGLLMVEQMYLKGVRDWTAVGDA